MITYLTKDITTVDRGIVAHGVNCSGAFGSGVAGAIRKKWPVAYERFKLMPTGKQMLGTAHMIRIVDDLYVINCYTQENYGSDGKIYASLPAVTKALEDCVALSRSLKLPLHIPKIGCGLGGLSWERDVEPIINILCEVPSCDIYVCSL